ncbi:putative ethanolaminephosphotransferase 1 [Apostichopus japonicus]|uniref:Putative ethanolaminephosphotransferase 1 n=1 Tax=Stichopus japonicus TaxID=307972 RepID=A0A2G8JPW5_STIJA|nr:putative ethanolaminephosphotransferase 1 [Apostichopus japonicus]
MAFDYRYLSKDHLKGFDKYKYSSIDNSPLSIYIMHPFWNKCVQFVPMWVAPNLLTFLGLLLILLLYLILAYLDWWYYASNRTVLEYPAIATSVWFFCAACQLVSHTLDGIDGKQARRTGSSTPLGELFDHGSDSVVAGLLPLALYSIFGKGMEDFGGNGWIFFGIAWNIVGQFVISHWEKYLTGVLFLPWGYDFAQLAMGIVYILTGAFGYEIWKGNTYFGFQFNYLFLVAVFVGFFLQALPQSIYNIYKSYRDGTGKGRSLYDAAEPMFPVLLLFLTSFAWGLFSPSDVMERDVRTYCLTFALVLSNITCRLIISQMTDTRAPSFNWLLLLYTVSAFVCCITDLGHQELYVLYAVFLLILIVHMHYGICVVRQLCVHFGIYAFSLQKRPKNHVK